MYERYWRLNEKPFKNTPDPRFIYYSQKYNEALSRIFYVVREKESAAVLTGEYGSGKTLLSRVLLEELSKEQYQPALIFNPRLPTLELLKEIIYQLGGDTSSLVHKIDLLHALNEILYKNKSENRNTVILIDEAQAIPEEETFEELRLLLNFQLNDNFLLTLILLGQPELKDKINNIPQLKQRIAVSYYLKALTPDETKEYIKHRLTVAGAKDEIFQEDAFTEIYRHSEGIPRRINNICEMALLAGYSEELSKIDNNTIIEVVKDMEINIAGIDDKTGRTING
ncbi:MAG: AAA family ATPase [Candidatus Omnitrophica bacterium]|nr:AAA family ATPase [Candidatus Omnitrophota bacterium]